MSSKGRGAALLAVLLLATFPGHAQEGEWPVPAGTVQGLRFSRLDEIKVTK
jgi:hypothetical protein